MPFDPASGPVPFVCLRGPLRTSRVPALRSQRAEAAADLARAVAERITSALVGVSSVSQLEQNLAALEHLDFYQAEPEEIERYAVKPGTEIWEEPGAPTDS